MCLVEVCAYMVMGEGLILMIVLRFQAVVKFGGWQVPGFLVVLGRPVPAPVVLEIWTPEVLRFFWYHVWLQH